MTMNFLAILISLAMMLTGAGGEGQPAEGARTLVLHNATLTYNDETVSLSPALRIGASTDGEKAVYDLGVEVDGEKLFPIQLGVDESGLTALFGKSDVAVKVDAKAFEALDEQLGSLMDSVATPQNEESAKVMNYIMNEYVPALTALVEATKDPDFVEALQAKGDALFDAVIDRGEGTPVDAEIDGAKYALTEYAYTIDSEQLAALVDGIYTSDDTLNGFYKALFGLYDLMPEESGLNGLTSFADVFSKTGLNMTMDVVEQLSDDKTVDRMDAVLTMDMSAVVAAAAAANEDANDVELPEIAPIVMNLSSSKVGDAQDATATCSYAAENGDENVAVDFIVNARVEGTKTATMDMNMNLAQNGKNLAAIFMNMSVDANEETGDSTHAIGYTVDADSVYVSLLNSGIVNADGTSTDNVMLTVNANGVNAALSFDVDVVADEIVDNANGHEATVLIDNLDQNNLNAFSEDEALQGALMQVVGSVMTDTQTLMADESVQKLAGLFTAIYSTAQDSPVVYYYSDESFEGDYEYEEPEDDGVLGYNEPKFTWLPEGWTLKEEEIDTTYDWVNLTYSNDKGGWLFVSFYQDYDADQVSYLVDDNGGIEAVEGREISVSDYGEGGLSVTLREAKLFGNLSFNGADIDVETIGKIVAGIEF